MSGYDERDVTGDLDALERTGLLQKPYDPPTLIATIDEVLRGDPGHSG